jgi:hypothetical protein
MESVEEYSSLMSFLKRIPLLMAQKHKTTNYAESSRPAHPHNTSMPTEDQLNERL